MAEIVIEATKMERALAARTSHYQRLDAFPVVSSLVTSGLGGSGRADMHEIISEVVSEELQCYFSVRDQPASVSIGAVLRDELRQAFESEVPAAVTTVEQPAVSYAEVLRQSPPVARQYQPDADRGLRRREFFSRQDARPEQVV